MTIENFYHNHCRYCGSQRCEGPKTKWIEGCKYRFELDEYAAVHNQKQARTAQPSVKLDQTIGKTGTA